MNRKEIAQETLSIQQEGFYVPYKTRVSIAAAQKHSEEKSELITPEQGKEIVKSIQGRLKIEGSAAPKQDAPLGADPIGFPTSRSESTRQVECSVANEATVRAVLDAASAGKSSVGVLNFASAKNPGGGFLRGAMAQEESLAASSGLYSTQLRHEEYYQANRAFRSMMYTDHAIYSPDVVFFRDERFAFLSTPVTASVLTLPAVNFGQVLQKGEDPEKAERVMKERMRLALAIFAARGDRHLVLGAYGCGVFRNDPVKVARWWRELLVEEGFGSLFDTVRFSVLDSSRNRACIQAFEAEFA
ncbi:TIGR02452 family protein [Gorillibacterium sp. CAU 1737]|uniref:TIGR02452 family protein n=1 Tax=Gorillibacterium sp. CAU 1737 TaxID=3140362 RepID=UPI003260C6A3